MKNTNGATHSSTTPIKYCLKNKYPSSAQPVIHSSFNQELLKSTSIIKVASMKNTIMYSIAQRKPSRATTKSTFFIVSKDEQNTEEDAGKSIKNALENAKRHLSG